MIYPVGINLWTKISNVFVTVCYFHITHEENLEQVIAEHSFTWIIAPWGLCLVHPKSTRALLCEYLHVDTAIPGRIIAASA